MATNILRVSGGAMIEALVSESTDPTVLSDLAKGKLKKKFLALQKVLVGRVRSYHAFLVSRILANPDYLEDEIEALCRRSRRRYALSMRQSPCSTPFSW